jgi:hypothetical protein
VLLAQIGTPAYLTYDNKRLVVPPNAEEDRQRIHQELGQTYLVRQAHVSGAVTVIYRLLKTKEKVLAKLTVDDLYDIAKCGITYESE